MKIKYFLFIFLFSFSIMAEGDGKNVIEIGNPYEDVTIIQSPKVVYDTTVIAEPNPKPESFDDIVLSKREIPNYIPAFMIDWGLKILIWYSVIRSYSVYYFNKILRREQKPVTKTITPNLEEDFYEIMASLED